MKAQHRKETFFLLLTVTLFSLSILASGAVKIRVTVNTANVRLKPDLKSMVIGLVSGGQVLEVLEKVENWYFINLPPDDKGIVVSGYIHRSVVEEISPETSPPPEEKKAEKEKSQVSLKKIASPPPSQAVVKPAQINEFKPEKPGRKRFFVRLGGGYASKTYSYSNNWSFPLYHENGQVNEGYKVDSSGVTFDGGFGFFFLPNVGVGLSFVPVAGKTTGIFDAIFPHPFYFNLNREASWEKTDLKYSATEIHLNLIFSFSASSRFNVYLSGGGTYFTGVKIENLKVIQWNEAGYPYFEVSLNPEYAFYTKDCFGLNVGGGLDYFFNENFGLNVNLRYAEGEAKLDVEGTELKIKTGGLRATAGVKIAF